MSRGNLRERSDAWIWVWEPSKNLPRSEIGNKETVLGSQLNQFPRQVSVVLARTEFGRSVSRRSSSRSR